MREMQARLSMKDVQRASKSFHILQSFVLVTLVLALTGAAIPAQAQTFTVIHDFLGAPNEPSFPATLVSVLGRDGDLFSQSYSGGTGNNGTIFKATPSGTITVLRNNEAGCKPNWLSMGSDGNLYGACGPTAASPNGYIWQLTPGGTFTDLHDFNGSGDGYYPLAPLLAADGNIYGVTYQGGANDLGTFYKRSPGGTLTTLHTFDSGNNGNAPQCIPTQGAGGDFYCTTTGGGANGDGTVFKISSAGKFSLLHTFTGGASDGVLPSSGVILATDGNFYGTTLAGGASNQGTVFKMTASGKVTLLHSFNGSTDGGYPANGVTQGSDGNLYGAANDCNGGCGSNWTAYKVTRTGVFTVLHTFNGGSDGRLPDGGIVQLTNGIFYGVCEQGGNGNGTLWTINTDLGPFVNLVSTSGKEGTHVGILGQGFSSSSVVKFGGTAASTIVLTGTTFITATVPAGALTGSVTVTTGATTLKSPQTFKVLPTITSFTPASGPVGTPITITGTGLIQTTLVKFGTVAATSVTVNSDTQVTADVPAGATTATIHITTKGGTAASKTKFTVN